MIEIMNLQQCCGCGACAQSCPKHCITMTADNEGFLYPVVEKDKCIDCGLCEKVCPELHPMGEHRPIKVAAVVNKNETVRLRSSSGGVFFALAQTVICEGGIVFGARFDEHWQVVIDYAETMDEVEAFMGSKYVQASIGNTYSDARRFLHEGRKVLFSGTPCQIAGLHRFLRKSFDNLLTVDFICHGTPSPKVWDKYLKEQFLQPENIKNVNFKNKVKSWKNYGFHIIYEEKGETIFLQSSFRENPYMKAFLSDLILRPSCYSCNAKSGRSHSDITIADFWGIDKVFPYMDDDKGTGLVFVNSEKGKFIFNLPDMWITETDYETVKPLNPACYRSVQPHPKRKQFFRQLDKKSSVIELILNCTKPPLKYRLYAFMVKCKKNVNRDSPMRSIPIHDLEICSISFRNKCNGWKEFSLVINVHIEK